MVFFGFTKEKTSRMMTIWFFRQMCICLTSLPALKSSTQLYCGLLWNFHAVDETVLIGAVVVVTLQ